MRFKSITKYGYKPFVIVDSGCSVCSGRPAQSEIILSSTIDIIKWLCIISGYFIELCYRKIGEKSPCLTAIKRLIYTTIIPVQQVTRIFRIDPQRVVINMLILLAYVVERLSTIFRNSGISIHYIHQIHIYRISDHFLIIITT